MARRGGLVANHQLREAVLMRRVNIECGTTTATLPRCGEVDFGLPTFADAATLTVCAPVARSLPVLAGSGGIETVVRTGLSPQGARAGAALAMFEPNAWPE